MACSPTLNLFAPKFKVLKKETVACCLARFVFVSIFLSILFLIYFVLLFCFVFFYFAFAFILTSIEWEVGGFCFQRTLYTSMCASLSLSFFFQDFYSQSCPEAWAIDSICLPRGNFEIYGREMGGKSNEGIRSTEDKLAREKNSKHIINFTTL